MTFDVAGNIDIPTAIIQGSNTGQSNVFTLNAGNLVNLNAQINTVAGTELLMRSLNGSGANGIAGTGFGGVPPAEVSQRGSTVALIVLAVVFTTLAIARMKRAR